MSTHHLPESEVISVHIEDHIATVWLDREEQMNAFAPDFWVDLPRIMESLGDDPAVRVIVIAARGKAFTVGIDLKAFGPSMMAGGGLDDSDGQPVSGVAKRRDLYRSVKKLQQTFTAIADCPKPVIAAIHGYCIGAGVDLITACDIRFASRDTVFSVRETQIAMVADVGTMQRLPKIIDPGRVAELVFTGKDFGAAEAFEMGLISRIASDAGDVQKQAHDVARAIAANSPLAVQGSKAVLKAGEGRSINDALDYVALWNSSFISSNDFTEAITAFMEKRPPEFTGQ
ncbi:MAG: crotonase/enoyl-CoA hydratase family protein [Actinomycetota bacterium]|nr:crotonase/enoyl-CoA hydratase family protein [Actinomycetota bacterium]